MNETRVKEITEALEREQAKNQKVLEIGEEDRRSWKWKWDEEKVKAVARAAARMPLEDVRPYAAPTVGACAGFAARTGSARTRARCSGSRPRRRTRHGGGLRRLLSAEPGEGS